MVWTSRWVSLLFTLYLSFSAVGLVVVMLYHSDRTRRFKEWVDGLSPVRGRWLLQLGLAMVYLSPVLFTVVTIGMMRRH